MSVYTPLKGINVGVHAANCLLLAFRFSHLRTYLWQEFAKICQESAKNLPRTRWSTIAATHRLHIHPPCPANEIPDRQYPKWGGGGDWPLATFN